MRGMGVIAVPQTEEVHRQIESLLAGLRKVELPAGYIHPNCRRPAEGADEPIESADDDTRVSQENEK